MASATASAGVGAVPTAFDATTRALTRVAAAAADEEDAARIAVAGAKRALSDDSTALAALHRFAASMYAHSVVTTLARLAVKCKARRGGGQVKSAGDAADATAQRSPSLGSALGGPAAAALIVLREHRRSTIERVAQVGWSVANDDIFGGDAIASAAGRIGPRGSSDTRAGAAAAEGSAARSEDGAASGVFLCTVTF